jgi:hypothetical protein
MGMHKFVIRMRPARRNVKGRIETGVAGWQARQAALIQGRNPYVEPTLPPPPGPVHPPSWPLFNFICRGLGQVCGFVVRRAGVAFRPRMLTWRR